MAHIREKSLCTSAVLPCARARPAFVGPGCGATLPVRLPPAPRGGVGVGGRLVVWVNKRLCDSPLSTQSGDQGPCPEERRCASKSRRRARPARAGGVCSAPKHNGCYNPRARTRWQVRGASRRPAGAVVLPQCLSVRPGKSSPNTCKRVKKKPRARAGGPRGRLSKRRVLRRQVLRGPPRAPGCGEVGGTRNSTSDPGPGLPGTCQFACEFLSRESFSPLFLVDKRNCASCKIKIH